MCYVDWLEWFQVPVEDRIITVYECNYRHRTTVCTIQQDGSAKKYRCDTYEDEDSLIGEN
jgi:hypothetical protein